MTPSEYEWACEKAEEEAKRLVNEFREKIARLMPWLSAREITEMVEQALAEPYQS